MLLPSPEVARLRRVDLGSEPSSRVLVIKDVVQEFLSLRLYGGIIDENAIRNHPVLFAIAFSEH